MDWSAFLSQTQEAVNLFVKFLATGLTVFLGLVFAYSGLKKMVAHSKGERHGQPTAGPVLINLAVASLFFQFSRSIDVGMNTLFGSSAQPPSAIMSYMPSQVTGNPMLKTAVEIGVWWVFAVGFVAVIRGLILWNELANGASQRGGDVGWRGLWHIVFGLAAINLTGVLAMFKG